MIRTLREAVQNALEGLGITSGEVHFEHPEDLLHGDYSTNVALVFAKEAKQKPKELAEKIVEKLKQAPLGGVRIEVAGPGFVNFFLPPDFFLRTLTEALKEGTHFGKGNSLTGKKVMVEYTDPNPFKEFHIGHLMSNTIGESTSRLVSFEGAEVKRANYQGDVGLHVAKAIWAFLHAENPSESDLAYGQYYVRGNEAYEQDEKAKADIQEINKKLYAQDPQIIAIYRRGKQLSLETFDRMYQKLGTVFDFFFFESEVAPFGTELVKKHEGSVFERSDGAIVFKGEKYDSTLHTRVFLNSHGLPTYEAKELGLAKKKAETYPFDLSISVTGNEIREYFKVLKKAMELVLPELQGKILHLPHGMLRVPGGKMSSRRGNVITGEALLKQVTDMIREKIKEREMPEKEKEQISEVVAIGAIKYSILRQAIGGDIIFDFEKSISFEGDSGPYLQYSCVRAQSVLKKAKEGSVQPSVVSSTPQIGEMERMLCRFPEVVERAAAEYAPHLLVTYLTEVSSLFNQWYAHTPILDAGEETPHRLALTEIFAHTIRSGLSLLGIQVPDRM